MLRSSRVSVARSSSTWKAGVGWLALIAAFAVAWGALYALFGPVITSTEVTTLPNGERVVETETYSRYSDGLAPLAWAVFAAFGLAGVGLAAGGLAFLAGRRRREGMIVIVAATAVLVLVGGTTMLTVGYLLTPGAGFAVIAAALAVQAVREERDESVAEQLER